MSKNDHGTAPVAQSVQSKKERRLDELKIAIRKNLVRRKQGAHLTPDSNPERVL